MKIQSIELLTANRTFQRNKLKKVPQNVKPKIDPAKDMNRNFTIAAIAALIIEIGMVAAVNIKNKHERKEQNTKTELKKNDDKNSEQTTLQINDK